MCRLFILIASLKVSPPETPQANKIFRRARKNRGRRGFLLEERRRIDRIYGTMSELPPKKISLKTIAQLAGCSTTTVSNILNKKGLFGDEIRDRVLEIVRKYNYAINASARSLKMGKSETVALVFYRPNVDIFVSEYYLKMMYGFQKRLAELGFEILLSEVSPENAENGARPRFVSRGKADAIVVLGQVPDSIVKSLRDCGLPMLMLDSHFDGIDSIYTDGRAATAALTAHIAALGHKRVAYLAYDNSDFNTDGRIDGFEKTAAQANLAAKVFRNFKTNDEGCDVLEKVLAAPDRPTAILASNDDLATSLMRRARELGLKIPQDIAFCGFDDTVLASRCTPKLTTVHVDCPHIGAIGAETIVERMKNPEKPRAYTVFPVETVVRESTDSAFCQ